jgi:hypothetical protein
MTLITPLLSTTDSTSKIEESKMQPYIDFPPPGTNIYTLILVYHQPSDLHINNIKTTRYPYLTSSSASLTRSRIIMATASYLLKNLSAFCITSAYRPCLVVTILKYSSNFPNQHQMACFRLNMRVFFSYYRRL